MFQRKPRRFRRRSNGRGQMSHGNGFIQSRPRPSNFVNSHSQSRNNFRTNQNVEKLFEKYTNLAKEAMSSGDKTMCENYLQHADHFMRVIEEKNKNREQAKVSNFERPTDVKNPSDNTGFEKKDLEKDENININKDQE
tara:strand:- start:277 stop:690 length:414 start_codon:yes stop_codon:yes gene_type:complete